MSQRSNSKSSAKDSRAQQQIRRSRRRRWPIYRISLIVVIVLAGVVIGLHLRSSTSSATPQSGRLGSVRAVGLVAPNGIFTTTAGRQVDVRSLRGKATLLWFVSTWCSSCQAGTQTMAQNISRLRSDGVRVVEVELYRDLDQSGPSIELFGRQLAGRQFTNPDWTFASSSYHMTRTYDPLSYLDIYYLLNAQGRIVYVNGSPSSTMPNILHAAAQIS